jgi:hypothetical protein
MNTRELMAKAVAERPDWRTEEPTYEKLKDTLLPEEAYQATVEMTRKNMQTYGGHLPFYRILDDMIARGLITYKFEVDEILGDMAND